METTGSEPAGPHGGACRCGEKTELCSADFWHTTRIEVYCNDIAALGYVGAAYQEFYRREVPGLMYYATPSLPVDRQRDEHTWQMLLTHAGTLLATAEFLELMVDTAHGWLPHLSTAGDHDMLENVTEWFIDDWPHGVHDLPLRATKGDYGPDPADHIILWGDDIDLRELPGGLRAINGTRAQGELADDPDILFERTRQAMSDHNADRARAGEEMLGIRHITGADYHKDMPLHGLREFLLPSAGAPRFPRRASPPRHLQHTRRN